VGLGFIRVDWEVDWGVMDMMLSSIAPEVTRISQHFQKGVMGCNTNTASPSAPLAACHPKVFTVGAMTFSLEPEPGALPDCLIQMALSHVFITLSMLTTCMLNDIEMN